jgi:hypothetical protein
MQIANVGAYPLTVGSLIAVLVLILAVLGMAGVLPFTAVFVFGLLAALAIARLT